MNVLSRNITGIVAAFLFVVLTVGGAGHTVSAQDDTLAIWTKFNDQNPQVTSDRWLAETLEAFETETGIAGANTFVPFDQINSRLNVAVQSGGDVPDVSYVDSQFLGFYYQNGALTDLTDFVTSAGWYDDLDANALSACTTPDGMIVCVPTSIANFFMYYWTDMYPDGFPTTTEEFMARAAELKEQGDYAITFKATEPGSIERFYYGLITSLGAELADDEGRATWTNPEAIAAVSFIRDLFTNEYAPEVALAPGFDYETPFKDGEAGSMIAGSFSYVYLTPLTAPDGTSFAGDIPETGFDPQALAVGAAGEAGQMGFAPPIAGPDGEPASLVLSSAWAIPVGAQNVEAAQAFIDFQMQTASNIAFAVAYGALPSLASAQADAAFESDYWQAVSGYLADYGVAAPVLADYDLGLTLLSDAITRAITDPNSDIEAELQSAQDEYNASIAY